MEKMNAFVRQLAALSVLWALCELLLPEGRGHQAVRLTVSVLVMTALLSGMGKLVQSRLPAITALASQAQTAASQSYAETALRAAANQVQGYCVRAAGRAGYQAGVTAYLRQDGAIDHIAIVLQPNETPPLMQKDRLLETLAQQLHIQPSQITEASP